MRSTGNRPLLTPKSASGYGIASDSVDSVVFESAVRKARQTRRLVDWEITEELWTGTPYPGLDDVGPVHSESERLKRLRSSTRLERAEVLMSEDRKYEACDELGEIVSAEPFNEEALGLYMKALNSLGRKREALSAFRSYESALAAESGLEPSVGIRELELSILVDELGHPPVSSTTRRSIDLSISYVGTDSSKTVAVGRAGGGPPLVVHPGWLSRLDMVASGADFRANLWAELARRSELILFDRFGTGMSQGSPPDVSFEASVEELKSVIRHSADGPVPVLAASGAGPIVIQAAVESPELISHLILLGTYASGPSTFSERVTDSMIALVKASWGMGSDVIANMLFPGGSVEFREVWSTAQRDLASPEMATKLLIQMFEADVSESLGSLSQPCLVIHYRGDKAVPIAGGEHLARHIPEAQFVSLPGITHYPRPGEEQAVVELISGFLTRTGL